MVRFTHDVIDVYGRAEGNRGQKKIDGVCLKKAREVVDAWKLNVVGYY